MGGRVAFGSALFVGAVTLLCAGAHAQSQGAGLGAPEPAYHYHLLLDKSGSMRGQRLVDLKRAVAVYASALPPLTSTLTITPFDTGKRRSATFRPPLDARAVQQALAALTAGGGTHVWDVLDDAVDAASSAIRKMGATPVIVLFTDGDDKGSHTTKKAVFDSFTGKIAEADAGAGLQLISMTAEASG